MDEQQRAAAFLAEMPPEVREYLAAFTSHDKKGLDHLLELLLKLTNLTYEDAYKQGHSAGFTEGYKSGIVVRFQDA